MKILGRLEKSKDFWFALIVSSIFFLLRLPSLFEPYWYGDEGIYQTIGIALSQGKLLYRDIFDNKPPLIYLLYSLFNSDQFTVRLVSIIFGLLSVVVFFLLTKKLFSEFKTNNRIACYFSTAFFAFIFGLPLIEGNIANAENFMLLPIILSALLIINQKQSNLFLAGLLLGVAFLFKVVSVFDFAALFLFISFVFFNNLQKHLKIKEIAKVLGKQLFSFVVGFLLPITITCLFFLLKGAFSDFLNATLSTNVGYVGYGNKLFGIPQGLLFAKFLALSIFSLIIFIKRNRLGLSSIFILLWFSFSLFNAFFSERPYGHYLLVLLPSFSLLLGLFIVSNKFKQIYLVLVIGSLLLILKNFSIYPLNKNVLYYANIFSFITDKENVTSYQSFFDKKTPMDYEIAQFIKPKVKATDSIFIWGNNAQVYKLINMVPPGKYIVAYHMVNYHDGLTNTKIALEKKKPKFIITMPDQAPIPFSLANYFYKINIDNVAIYERLF
ncbi:MAG: glycosyltransferase family 39 protein [Candidatus Levybacteria bacterium]|nr:glycosyltransferase family 39 protein [Candidatus Levybacteria bacterium]